MNDSFIKIISSIYHKPSFLVQAMNHSTTVRTASTGIRQGCPLSPYLFLIVHSAIMHDVETAITNNNTVPAPWIHSQQHPLFDLAYADDTVILAKSQQKAQQILQTIQRIAQQSNLHLNMSKCEMIRTKAEGTVHFLDGTAVKTPQYIKYLGVILRADG